jgi:hypothetical protein
MWFTSLLSSLPARAGHRPKTARNRARHRFVPRLEILEDRSVPSTLTVTNTLDKGAGSLRDAIAHASSGDTIVFDPSLNGQTITLTSDQLNIQKNLDIEGPGASQLAISGNGTYRVFNIPQGNSVTIAGLTITQGLSNGKDDLGGGVLVAGSTLALTNDVFSYNEAAGGGALDIANGANATVSGCTFRDNVANAQGSESGDAAGGAILNDETGANSSTLTVQNSTFTGNEAIGGNGVVANPDKPHGVGDAQAGAIESEGAAGLTVTNCTFSGNMAIAGNGGSAANSSTVLNPVDCALGGAIHVAQTTLVVSGSTFTKNEALGGSNGTGGATSSGSVGVADGGALSTQFGTATITNSVFDSNLAQGGSGNSGGSGSLNLGWADGGAIGNFFAGTTLVASNVTFSNNQAVGGAGNGSGLLAGDGLGGGLANFDGATATLSCCTFTGNQATGGAGGSGANGANGFGGGVYNDGLSILTILLSTITGNQASGGAAGAGGSAGLGEGGGVYFATGGTVCLDAYTVAHILSNTASTSNNDVFGVYTIC